MPPSKVRTNKCSLRLMRLPWALLELAAVWVVVALGSMSSRFHGSFHTSFPNSEPLIRTLFPVARFGQARLPHPTLRRALRMKILSVYRKYQDMKDVDLYTYPRHLSTE